MAGQIRLSPEELRGKANDFGTKGEEVDTLVSGTQGLIDQLISEWEGSAAVSFEEQFETLRPSIEAMAQLMRDLQTQLNSAAEIYETADQEMASSFGVS